MLGLSVETAAQCTHIPEGVDYIGAGPFRATATKPDAAAPIGTEGLASIVAASPVRGAPNLSVHLEAAPQAEILAGLLGGRFDLGVLGADPDHVRLEAKHIGREELCLVLPADADDTPLSFADLEARGFIAHPDGYGYADDLLRLNFPDNYPGADRLSVRGSVNQIGQIPAPVAKGVGYTLLPRSGVEAFTEKESLSVFQLPKRRWHDLWLVVRRGRCLSARARYARDVIEEAAGQLR